jgi:hypothetical protein
MTHSETSSTNNNNNNNRLIFEIFSKLYKNLLKLFNELQIPNHFK